MAKVSYFMYIGILFACMSVYHLCAESSWRPEEGNDFSGTEVTDNCKIPHGCCKLNLGTVVYKQIHRPMEQN